MPTLVDRLAAVQARIQQACDAAGRDRDSVRLLAATKTRTAVEIAEGVRAGLTLVGENRAQELRDKFGLVAALLGDDLAPPQWHFIGPLQRNKVKYVVGRATMVHSVESLKLARALSERVQTLTGDAPPAAPPLSVLVEVNVGGEQSKAGVAPEAALDLCAEVAELPGLDLQGLMTIPPVFDDDDRSRACFARLRALAEQGRSGGLPLHELSMGMSGDLHLAIAEGATIVRVGTAIFGPRRG